jgi:PHD/YefM family antitoxin component YafN of YafNO toxin-antitoxin module
MAGSFQLLSLLGTPTTTLTISATKAYGQLLGRDFNPLAKLLLLRTSVPYYFYLQTDASIILADLEKNHQPVIVTQNGQAKAVLQDIVSYEATQDSLALLKILAMSSKSKQEGKSKPIKTAFEDIRKSIAEAE